MRRVALGCLLGLLSSPAWSQTRAGGEFQVNTYTTGPQNGPSVAVNDNGDFVVAWASSGEDGSDYGVRWRKYSAAGVSMAEGQANSYTTGSQFAPAVALDEAGKFVITWTSFGQDGNEYGIFARRFDAAGNPLAPEFTVNSHTANRQFVSHISGAPNGNFVVAWRSVGQDGDGYGVFARLYDSSGLPVTSDLQVNTYITGQQTNPVVAMNPTGKFVVV